MKIGFSGTSAGMTTVQKQELEFQLGIFAVGRDKIEEAHHGMCIGADAQFHKIIQALIPDLKIVGHPGFPEGNTKRANVIVHELNQIPSTGPLGRNIDIVCESDLLIACPRQMSEVLRSGTWSTVRYARKAKREIIVIFPDGTTESEGFFQ